MNYKMYMNWHLQIQTIHKTSDVTNPNFVYSVVEPNPSIVIQT